jgi:hypothetical protein
MNVSAVRASILAEPDGKCGMHIYEVRRAKIVGALI